MLYKTEGMIIKRSNLGDFDRLLTVYTRDFGKISVRGKAIRKNQSKLKGHLELFLQSRLLIAPGKKLDIITGAEIIRSFSKLHQRLPSLAAAYYLAEIIDKTIIGPERDPQIWQLLLTSFQKLDQEKTEPKIIIDNFEKQLLGLLGYGQGEQTIISLINSLFKEKIYSRLFLQKALCLLR
ncbi:MAG: DNA repair protein RecO [Candidatus Portnoybacteria bacterium CG23_combo_of_CG06-09_8_20_14_all_37_13]|uniref:DNA repair protein RecO n=2 Tax=Candidatus Portnoyibacteriota TaxID=1817913 RepID=A0A2G9YCC1_9BACT|nr:MAG: DNA repair protein RecO [Candidatus Portnoybacteria bacterium CG23_combo_of_CG06-09_8_20_14_all_37_13]